MRWKHLESLALRHASTVFFWTKACWLSYEEEILPQALSEGLYFRRKRFFLLKERLLQRRGELSNRMCSKKREFLLGDFEWSVTHVWWAVRSRTHSLQSEPKNLSFWWRSKKVSGHTYLLSSHREVERFLYRWRLLHRYLICMENLGYESSPWYLASTKCLCLSSPSFAVHFRTKQCSLCFFSIPHERECIGWRNEPMPWPHPPKFLLKIGSCLIRKQMLNTIFRKKFDINPHPWGIMGEFFSNFQYVYHRERMRRLRWFSEEIWFLQLKTKKQEAHESSSIRKHEVFSLVKSSWSLKCRNRIHEMIPVSMVACFFLILWSHLFETMRFVFYFFCLKVLLALAKDFLWQVGGAFLKL